MATSFIAQKHSCQEFQPLVGKVNNQAHVDPLHLKNNACALLHIFLLEEVLQISNIGKVNSFSDILATCPFYIYINALRNVCNLSRLSKRLIRWFNDTKGDGKTFDYRFTGKDIILCY